MTMREEAKRKLIAMIEAEPKGFVWIQTGLAAELGVTYTELLSIRKELKEAGISEEMKWKALVLIKKAEREPTDDEAIAGLREFAAFLKGERPDESRAFAKSAKAYVRWWRDMPVRGARA